ncbi:MAG: cytochrome c3 family protein [Candidatus Eisenbacteria bacterium]|nr:cytochrome c3 family protein [Candidatus Eisenbacteria bacterium]
MTATRSAPAIEHAGGGRRGALAPGLLPLPALASLAAGLLLLPALALAQPGNPNPDASAPTAVSPGSGRCGVCHPTERVQFEKSQHAEEGVRCTSCHGGNDRSLEVASAHGAGFRGRPARKDVPALCASCHSSEARMRPYNLPVDQHALYQTSGHGRLLARGDTRVAVCSDCHGAHDILPPKDPASRTFTLNIPRTCGACHGDSTLMKQRGKPDVFRLYMGSVHARELYDRGNLRAPTCVSCHGVHGAAPPALGDVDKVCGQCHTAERRYFMAGGHYRARSGDDGPECASCHEAHTVQAAQPERLAGSCAQCHAKDAKTLALGRRIWTDYHSAADEVEKAAALTARADAVPLQTDDYRARIEEARTYLREALPAAHAVQEDVVAGFTTRARSMGHEVQSEIYGKLGHLRQRKFVLILFWFYLLLTLLVLKRYRDQGARKGSPDRP